MPHIIEGTLVTHTNIGSFTHAYMTALLWSSTNEASTPLDRDHDSSDFAPEARESIERDCKAFYDAHAETWDNQYVYQSQYSEDDLAGHDFWLTRAGHGAGFWDGDWCEPAASTLTAAAKAFGEQWPHVGDDGQVYI